MPRQRPTSVRPNAKRSSDSSDGAKAKVAAHAPKAQPPAGSAKAKLAARTLKAKRAASKIKPSAPKVRLHQSGGESVPEPPVRQIPWWVFPENERALQPGGTTGGGTAGGSAGLLPPGPGPGPIPGPGPGPTPGPGPGPGPGPFPPPGPGPIPGPGPFPPPPGPGPGPGPFPPPPPRPPGPFPPPRPPFPFPPPRPPFPFPPQPFPAYIAIRVNGGFAFPGITQTTYVGFYPGITIGVALQLSGLVTFGFGGRITSVAGIRIGRNVAVRILYNGRVIPESLLNLPADPFSSINLLLYFI